jgi:hypothetical protein
MPGLLGLPAFLWRKLSPRGRKVAAWIGVLLLAGAVAAAIVLVPRIAEVNRNNAAAARRAAFEAAKRQRAALVAEQRPRAGRVGRAAAPVPAVERAITDDARARAASGELDNPAHETDCHRIGRDGDRTLLACTAITSDVAGSDKVSGVVVGYSYRAAVTPADGRFAFCKVSGRPAVGFESYGLPAVKLPRVCGG